LALAERAVDIRLHHVWDVTWIRFVVVPHLFIIILLRALVPLFLSSFPHYLFSPFFSPDVSHPSFSSFFPSLCFRGSSTPFLHFFTLASVFFLSSFVSLFFYVFSGISPSSCAFSFYHPLPGRNLKLQKPD